MSERLFICDHAADCTQKCPGKRPRTICQLNEDDSCLSYTDGVCAQGLKVNAILYPPEPPMEYELIKAVSIRALEEAGACERELHRFAFLAFKRSFDFDCSIDLADVLDIASQCEGGIRFLVDKGFIRDKQPELKPCPFCGDRAAFGTVNYSPNSEAAKLNGHTEYHFVNCVACGADNQGLLGHKTKESAMKAWNTRV